MPRTSQKSTRSSKSKKGKTKKNRKGSSGTEASTDASSEKKFTPEEEAWRDAFASMKPVKPAKKKNRPPSDFEDDLRKELGLKKKKKMTFEQELRSMAREIRERKGEEIEYGARPGKPVKKNKKSDYDMPVAKKFKADFKGRPKIDEILVMGGPGLLLRHFRYRDSTMMDDDLVASMITVIQNFVRESFQKTKADLKELRLGEFNILILKGNFFKIVVISPADDLRSLERPITKMIAYLEKKNQKTIKTWKGDIDEFIGIEGAVKKLIKGGRKP